MQSAGKITLASDAPGHSLFLLGNEAIARGAIEAGVQVFAAYPGTPSSEISETLINLSRELNIYAEWSVNEKVAFELAYGACISGVRSMTAMKMVGLNVAHDSFTSAAYMGTAAGMLLVNADDPGIWSSQNEQDNRLIAEQAYVPILEPSSVQEAKDMAAHAFELSEQFGQIFMLRSVTRISHARGDVKLGIINRDRKGGEFKKEPRFSCLPVQARKNHLVMNERFNKIKEFVEKLPYNQLKPVQGVRLGIIAAGISYSYATEALRWLGLEERVPILKIGTPHPLPEKMVRQLISSVPEVLVIEELEPFVENHVKIIAQEAGIQVKIRGKDLVPITNELSTRLVAEAISRVSGAALPINYAAIDKTVVDTASILPARPPTLCAGCPHRASFYAINVATRKVKKELGEKVLTGDIGCYTLGYNPPLNSFNLMCCMGGGFGLANGVARGQSGPVIGHLGDSTFFHSGITPMIDAVFNNTRVTFVILDNSATAMTGFQPHPGTPGNNLAAIKPEDLARACNVKFVEVV
ncbi:MAG: indolepyruvate ferredoxin oxidoreductase subunit alpha, partial [Chloroflexi bacterium]|nr:indolepyruvate ferredoxin oxidoreductase subunit alpha [Chloroflexota bacterium]